MGGHYLRVVRALALGAALIGCGDDEPAETPDAPLADAPLADASVADGSPDAQTFDAPRDAAPMVVDGPLAPPDLPRAA